MKTKTADRELIVTRLIDAPREMVFDAFTEIRQVGQWWGPQGFSTTIFQMDVRPGGVWRFVMHGPDGRDYPNHIIYLEIVRPERLVYRHVPMEGSEWVDSEVAWMFADKGGRTEVTMHMVFPSAALRAHIIKTYGVEEGAEQTLARLADNMVKEAAWKTNPTARETTITRIFDAPRRKVFQAWTDPEHIKHWWGPGGFTTPLCQVDARPGGAIRIDMCGPDGTVYPMTGTFEEIAEPERLVFTSGALGRNGWPLFEVRHTVTFEEHSGKTRLTMHARVLRTTPEGLPHLGGMDQGWNQSLDRLGAAVKSA